MPQGSPQPDGPAHTQAVGLGGGTQLALRVSRALVSFPPQAGFHVAAGQDWLRCSTATPEISLDLSAIAQALFSLRGVATKRR